jgi:Protein of unknown function (DUF2587)
MTQPSDETPQQEQQIVVVGPDGVPLPGMIAVDTDGDGAPDQIVPVPTANEGGSDLTDLVSQPAKVMRIGSMIKQLLDEVKASPLDEASRARLRDIHRRSISELEDGLAPELVEELERLSLPFDEAAVPSESELRIAQAQLVGWLEGLFHGIQTALFAQQMAAQAQFEEMRRRALPPGQQSEGGPTQEQRTTGPYL